MLPNIKFNYNLPYKIEASDKDFFELENLKKINIFIGANNSGKSRLMREIFKNLQEPILLTSSELKHSKIDFLTKIDVDFLKTINDNCEMVVKEMIETKQLDDKPDGWKNLHTTLTSRIDSIENKNDLLNYNQILDYINKINGLKTGNESKKTLIKYIELVSSKISNIIHYHSTYIPVLRTLRNINPNQTGMKPLHEKVNQAYFSKIGGLFNYIFTGEKMFDEVKKLLLSEHSKRLKLQNFEKFLSKSFFDDKIVSLIPRQHKTPENKQEEEKPLDNYDLFIKIDNEKERPIYEVGDGVLAVILLTFPLFLNSDSKHIIFIEEPELFIHPAYQRILLKAFMDERFKDTQIFLTTHSNHFLDLSLEHPEELSIYSFHKEIQESSLEIETEPHFIVENISNPDIKLLDSLGVRNSSVFLANCTIWVEGITERLYLQKYLEVYLDHEKLSNKYIEDLHYAFVEYSGGNIVHWNFDKPNNNKEQTNAQFISNRIFLIADKDYNSDEKVSAFKEDRHTKLKDILKHNFYLLESKEIENTLKGNVIKKTLENYSSVGKFKSEDFDKISSNNEHESLKMPIYYNKNLGEFIDNILSKIKTIKSPKKFKNENTIGDKLNFCKKAISHIKTVEDLSDEAKHLCQEILRFIRENNKS
jgi:predicted ATP-dependent endonuclease of OLD family